MFIISIPRMGNRATGFSWFRSEIAGIYNLRMFFILMCFPMCSRGEHIDVTDVDYEFMIVWSQYFEYNIWNVLYGYLAEFSVL